MEAGLAAEITGEEMCVIFALYYVHERFWTRYSFGLESRREPPGNDPGI
jgi:bifunctional enzyme CysN/CysC/sulfate adenylyltransferase subunit 1